MPASDNVRGAALMSVAMAAFTINDTFMKSLSDAMPFFQAIFLRGAAVSVVLTIVVLAARTRFRLPPRDWVFIALRTAGEVVAAYFFISALFHAPLANLTAILQALPLTVTLAGALFLGEPVGWQRVTAIVVGFFGVLLIVRPGMEGFNVHSVYALISVAGVTLRDLATRQLSAGVPSLTAAYSGAVAVMLFGGIGTLAGDWAPVGARQGLALAGASAFVLAGYLLSVMTMRVGDIGFVALFRYTSLVWALLLGWAAFGEWPSALTLLGAAIVALTGLFTIWRERRVARSAVAAKAAIRVHEAARPGR